MELKLNQKVLSFANFYLVVLGNKLHITERFENDMQVSAIHTMKSLMCLLPQSHIHLGCLMQTMIGKHRLSSLRMGSNTNGTKTNKIG